MTDSIRFSGGQHESGSGVTIYASLRGQPLAEITIHGDVCFAYLNDSCELYSSWTASKGAFSIWLDRMIATALKETIS